jgi:hypothetical protein
MPLTWTVAHDEQLVHAIGTGEVGVEELLNYLAALIAERVMPYGKLFDVTETTSFAGVERLSEVGDTVRLYDRMKLGPIGPLAIVASDDGALVHAQMFLSAARADRPVRLLPEVNEARAWLIRLRDGSSSGTA